LKNLLKLLKLAMSNKVIMMVMKKLLKNLRIGVVMKLKMFRRIKLMELLRGEKLVLRRREGPRKEMIDHHLLMMMIMHLSLLGFQSRGRRLLLLNLQEDQLKLLKVRLLSLMFLALLKLNMYPFLLQP
jgi:hypothetical protein